MKKALVLSGGSTKGAFQAGAIAEVFESKFVPEGIYGTSVGSLNGGFLTERAGRAVANNDSPDWPAIGRALERFWLEEVTSFKKIGKKRNFLELALALLFNQYDGLIDTTPLRKLVYQEFKVDNIRQTPIVFSTCSVNIANGKGIYAHPQDANILEYIIASTAIPLMMPISMIGNEPFVDGGIREIAPLREAIKDGAEEIITIVCMPEDVGGAIFNRKNAIELAERLMDILENEIVNNDLRECTEINQVTPKDGSLVAEGPFAGKRFIKLTVIRPDKPIDISLEDFTPEDIKEAVSAGRARAKEVLGR